MNRKPLVIATDPTDPLDTSAQLQQLQGSDDLDIPLADRVERLELVVKRMVLRLMEHDIQFDDIVEGYIQ